MTRTPLRPGFTLVELLVVMSLVIVLAGITVAVAESGAFGSQKVVSAADRASGWLLIAKQRALRDQRPRGVRFLITLNPTTGNYEAREAQYIEVPDSWVPDRTRPAATRAFLAFVYQINSATPPALLPDTFVTAANYPSKAPNGHRVFVILPDAGEQAEFGQRVPAGSLLTLPGSGATYRIDQEYPGAQVQVNGQTYAGGQVVELVLGQATDSPVPGAPRFTYPDLGAASSPAGGTQTSPGSPAATEYNFAFTTGFSGPSGTGGPQPLVGEPLLQLTGNSVIDVRVNNTTFSTQTTPPYAFPTTAGVTVSGTAGNQFFDVLFAPSGQVLGASDGLICLWVRDPDKTPGGSPRYFSSPTAEARADAGNTQGFDVAGEQKLVVVYTRTGLIATHEILPPPADPYTAARDGLNSGL